MYLKNSGSHAPAWESFSGLKLGMHSHAGAWEREMVSLFIMYLKNSGSHAPAWESFSGLKLGMHSHAGAGEREKNPPIAILLCSSKDQEMVELMELEQDDIHISEYWLKLPPKTVLQEKLHKAIEEAELRLGVGDE